MRPLKRNSSGDRPWLPWAIAGGLLSAIALVYGQTLYFDFLNYDDQYFITRCPEVRAGLTGHGIVWAFTNGPAGDWYPLAMLSHMLDCQIYGIDHPGGHFLTNLVLHAATVLALFFVLHRMTGQRAVPGTDQRLVAAQVSGGRVAAAGPSAATLGPSALVAALLAIHPQHVESVAWLAERRDVLSGLLFMLTLAAYLGYVKKATGERSKAQGPNGYRSETPAHFSATFHLSPSTFSRYLLVLVLLALGLMAKPMLVTVPAVLLLLDYWPLGRFGRAADLPTRARGVARDSFPRLVLEKLPLAAIAATDAAITMLTHVPEANPLPLIQRLAYSPIAVVIYLVHSFDPRGLAPFYPYPAGGVPAGQVAAAVALLVAISVAVIVGRRKYPFCLVGWFWFLGMLVPVLGVISISHQAMADRYMYLPAIGLYIAVVFPLWRFAAANAARACVFGGAAAIALFTLAILAERQTSYWGSGITLWTHAIATTGSNPKAELSLAEALVTAGRPDASEEHYRRSLEAGGNPEAINNFGLVLLRKRKLAEAEEVFRKGLQVFPNSAPMISNFGVVLMEEKQRDQAAEQFRKAIELDGHYLQARLNMARLLGLEEKFDAARAYCRGVLEIDPNNGPALDILARLARFPSDGSEP